MLCYVRYVLCYVMLCFSSCFDLLYLQLVSSWRLVRFSHCSLHVQCHCLKLILPLYLHLDRTHVLCFVVVGSRRNQHLSIYVSLMGNMGTFACADREIGSLYPTVL